MSCVLYISRRFDDFKMILDGDEEEVAYMISAVEGTFKLPIVKKSTLKTKMSKSALDYRAGCSSFLRLGRRTRMGWPRLSSVSICAQTEVLTAASH